MTLRRLTALALMSGILYASPAFAEDEEDPEPEVATQADPEPEVADVGPWDRALAVSVTGGWDTPLGVVGGAVEFAPIEFLNIWAGGGVGRSGARVAGGLVLRFPVHSSAFGIHVGLAGGPMDWESRGDANVRIHRYWEFALYTHAAVSLEYRWDEGIFGRLVLGAEALVAGDVTECRDPDGTVCGPSSAMSEPGALTTNPPLYNPVYAFAGLSVGYAFDL